MRRRTTIAAAASSASTFEPGSTFKALTASTVIDAGGQTPTSTVVASSKETFANGARVRDSFSHPAYTYTLAGVLIDSSNAGISKFSERVSAQTRYDYFKKFGIGSGSAVGFHGEAEGPHPAGRRVGQPDRLQHRVRAGPHDDDAGARGRLRGDRQRRRADAALARRVVHRRRRHRRRARRCPSPTRVISEATAAADARDPRERRAAGQLLQGDRDPGLPHRG